DLAAYMEMDDTKLPTKKATIRTFFGCLAKGLEYLHMCGVRHKDIKPRNILVHESRILLTDFGLSRVAGETGNNTTSGPTIMTRRYCAPEVGQYTSRNLSSDIWSLGCVYLELLGQLVGWESKFIESFLQSNGNHETAFWAN
ncbi:kinase-like protein, partial [Patellaria atrata CBS 101060]